MIAYVDEAPEIELHGRHFKLTIASGSERAEFMLTEKAFRLMKAYCSQAEAKRILADMEAREKVVEFRRTRKAKRERADG
ncbi:hypothetical protein [Sphingomonas sp.]|uniref:hypothetical protein n=1 Tax=Sphingomonas sp. TaxID=28214 RepID=UPI0025D16358|nr:hypothetical protein [Sphingomonas sp.]